MLTSYLHLIFDFCNALFRLKSHRIIELHGGHFSMELPTNSKYVLAFCVGMKMMIMSKVFCLLLFEGAI